MINLSSLFWVSWSFLFLKSQNQTVVTTYGVTTSQIFWLTFPFGLKRKLNHSTCLYQEKLPNISLSSLKFFSFQLEWPYAYYYVLDYPHKNFWFYNIKKNFRIFHFYKPRSSCIYYSVEQNLLSSNIMVMHVEALCAPPISSDCLSNKHNEDESQSCAVFNGV